MVNRSCRIEEKTSSSMHGRFSSGDDRGLEARDEPVAPAEFQWERGSTVIFTKSCF